MAIPVITLVNQTASPISLTQLGVVVPASGNINVTGSASALVTVTDVMNDVQLQSEIGAGNITVEIDGTPLTSGQTQAVLTAINPLAVKHNLSATVDPTVTDDDVAGYSVGSRWVNTAADTTFVCLDDSTGAASWVLVATNSGDTSNYFEAYDAAGGTTVGGTIVDLPLDTQRISNSDYSHTLGSAVVTINTTGTYLVYGHFSTEIPSGGGTSRSQTAGALYLDAGAGFSEVPGTRIWNYNRTQGAGANSGSFMALMSLSSGDEIKLRALQTSGTSTVQTAAEGTGLMLTRIGIGAGIDAEQIQGRAVSTTAPTNNQVLVWNSSSSEWQPADQSGGGGDELVKISANDTTAGYLNGKLVAGANITLTEQNDGGNETLQVAGTSAPPGCQEVVSSTTITTTSTTPVAMTGMTLTAPATGSYLAIFSVYTENSLAGWSVRVRIHVNGTFQASTERHTQVNAAGYAQVLATTRRLSLTAGDSVQVYWYTGGSGTASAFERCFQLLRVTAV